MSAKLWENAYRSTMICIDSYTDCVPAGRFYNQYCPDGIIFHGAIDLVKKIDTMLDKMHFPQSFSSIRSFSENTLDDLKPPTQGITTPGKLATFSVRILFRQNTSWQGSVHWQEKNSEETFRSVLELLFLIDSAIEEDISKKEALP